MMSDTYFRWLSLALVVALSACNGDDADDQPDGSADTDADSGLCADAVEVMQPGPDGGAEIPTGIEECADGSAHRYAAIACTSDSFDEPLCAEGCNEGAGCPDGQRCVASYGSEDYCTCITPCAGDADCGPDEACLCAETQDWITLCLPASCRTDADCDGFECGVSRDCCGIRRLMCRTGDDACHGDAQCEEYYECQAIEDAWVCVESCDCE